MKTDALITYDIELTAEMTEISEQENQKCSCHETRDPKETGSIQKVIKQRNTMAWSVVLIGLQFDSFGFAPH